MKIEHITALINAMAGPTIILLCAIASLVTLAPEQKATLLGMALSAGATMTNVDKSSKQRQEEGRKQTYEEGEVVRYSEYSDKP